MLRITQSGNNFFRFYDKLVIYYSEGWIYDRPGAPADGQYRVFVLINSLTGYLDLSEGTIVTRGEDEQIQVESGKINVVPAWRFVLNLSAS